MITDQHNGKSDRRFETSSSSNPFSTHLGTLWRTMKRVIRGELRLAWVESKSQAESVSWPVYQPQPGLPAISLSKSPNGAVLPGPRVLPGPFPPINQPASGPSLTVYCLGAFRLYQNDQLIDKWPGRKARSIFKYLISHRAQPINAEVLMDLFWNEAEPIAARKSLHQAIYLLRQTLQKDCPEFTHILFEDSAYYLNPDLNVWVDSEVFAGHYEIGQRFEQKGQLAEAISAYETADSLYHLDFLAEDRYEDWPIIQRERLKHTHLDILDRLSRYYFEQNRLATAIAYCQKILAEDNCREDAHRLLMYCYSRQGQPHLALRQYHVCVEVLERELEVTPMPATIELYQKIQQYRDHCCGRE